MRQHNRKICRESNTLTLTLALTLTLTLALVSLTTARYRLLAIGHPLFSRSPPGSSLPYSLVPLVPAGVPSGRFLPDGVACSLFSKNTLYRSKPT